MFGLVDDLIALQDKQDERNNVVRSCITQLDDIAHNRLRWDNVGNLRTALEAVINRLGATLKV